MLLDADDVDTSISTACERLNDVTFLFEKVYLQYNYVEMTRVLKADK